GRNIAEISALGLRELRGFSDGLPVELPAELGRMTAGLLAELNGTLTPLLDVGLGYLTLDRPGATLSTGERQRIELTSTVRASTTGMLYVLDEPSVGLHPANVQGLRKTITALAGNGNTVLVVEHERELIRSADWVIELGPGAGANGGTVIAEGTPRRLDLGGIRQVVQIDASPIGQNARSTPATYSGAFDQIRRVFADSAYARRRRWKPGRFSFNTREGQCPTCRGLGHIDLDVQYLPDIAVQCPTCHGARFNDATLAVRVDGLTIADVLGLSVDDALERYAGRVPVTPVAAALRP